MLPGTICPPVKYTGKRLKCMKMSIRTWAPNEFMHEHPITSHLSTHWCQAMSTIQSICGGFYVTQVCRGDLGWGERVMTQKPPCAEHKFPYLCVWLFRFSFFSSISISNKLSKTSLSWDCFPNDSTQWRTWAKHRAGMAWNNWTDFSWTTNSQ